MEHIEIIGHELGFPMVGERCFFIVVHETASKAQAKDVVGIFGKFLNAVREIFGEKKFHFSSFLSSSEDPLLLDYFQRQRTRVDGLQQEKVYAAEVKDMFARGEKMKSWPTGARLLSSSERISKKMKYSTLSAREAAVADVQQCMANEFHKKRSPPSEYMVVNLSLIHI